MRGLRRWGRLLTLCWGGWGWGGRLVGGGKGNELLGI